MNKELFERIVSIFNSGDTSKIADIFTHDYLDHQKPEWFTVDGSEEFAQIVKLARDNLPNLKVAVVGPVIADGDMVAARLSWSSDKNERETLEILRIEDGKFAEHWGAKAWETPKSQS